MKRLRRKVSSDDDEDDNDESVLLGLIKKKQPAELEIPEPEAPPPKKKRGEKCFTSESPPETLSVPTPLPNKANGFYFERNVKRAMKPSVTLQFSFTWGWPTGAEQALHAAGLTRITELRSDPYYDENPRRVSIVVTCGRRFLLPLQPEPSDSATARETGVFWHVASRPHEVMRPSYAELLVGSVASLKAATDAIDDVNFTGASPEVPNVTETVGTFFFQTLPYRTLWLRQCRGYLLVSLPCEERVITISAKATSLREPMACAPHLRRCVLECASSFALPAGTVPLDLDEVYARPFVAIGTMSHGVLIVMLNSDGACSSIVHCIPLVGIATSFFPVTRICTVFPSLSIGEDKTNVDNTNAASSLRLQANIISSCLEGAVLCTCPFEDRTIVARCSASTSDGYGCDPPQSPRPLDATICCGSCDSPAIGRLISTTTGKLLRLSFDTPSSSDISFEQVARTLGAIPHIFCDGGAVLQLSKARYQPNFVRHWQCFGTQNHCVILLDQSTNFYSKHSTVLLTVPTKSSALRDVPSSFNVGQQIKLKEEEGEEEEEEEGENSGKLAKKKTNKNEETSGGSIYPPPIEDVTSGLCWLNISDSELQVLVAHHQNWLSVITWKA